ncbi:MAG: M48 family metallopeptidase [Rhodospirillaceae bacterium]|nr:M48 family metallopeptidase [Rhodospirillaceae bacterium]MBT7759584.1 M48 family metallopeptidase [Rhodospirillaceae bacterium]
MTVHRDFEFEVKRSARRRTLCLQIRDGQVQVMVPTRTPDRQIQSLVNKNSDWIKRKLREQAARPKAVPKKFVDGESYTYLGQEHVLRVVEGAPWPAELVAGEIIVTRPARLDEEARRAAVERRLHEWYRLMALEAFEASVEHYTEKLDVMVKAIKVKAYKRRWGSCSARGELSFNWRLIMAPAGVVDYVAAHEVAHLVHHNHSADFWAVVSDLMPDYRDQQVWLHKFGGLLDI